MTYDLRRLRLHGLVEKVERSHRYLVTEFGLRAAMCITRSWDRLLRPGLSIPADDNPPAPTPLARALDKLEQAMERL